MKNERFLRIDYNLYATKSPKYFLLAIVAILYKESMSEILYLPILKYLHLVSRWKEVMRTVDNDGYHPMEKLIAIAPEVASVVLDKSVTVTKENHVSPSSGKVLVVDKIHYDFEFLDIMPDQQVNQIFFGPSNMVKHQRENLLKHRLTVKLIGDKWARLGRWIYMLSLFFYVLFLALLTALLIIDKERYVHEVTYSYIHHYSLKD